MKNASTGSYFMAGAFLRSLSTKTVKRRPKNYIRTHYILLSYSIYKCDCWTADLCPDRNRYIDRPRSKVFPRSRRRWHFHLIWIIQNWKKNRRLFGPIDFFLWNEVVSVQPWPLVSQNIHNTKRFRKRARFAFRSVYEWIRIWNFLVLERTLF